VEEARRERERERRRVIEDEKREERRERRRKGNEAVEAKEEGNLLPFLLGPTFVPKE